MTRRAYGLKAWFLQRVSAVYIAAFSLFLVFYFTISPPASYEEWREWVARPAVGVAGALFFAGLLIHVWVGIRDVFMDYVHPTGLRVIMLSVLGLALWAFGFWALDILLLAKIS